MGMTWRWVIFFVFFWALGTPALQHDSHQHMGETSAVDRAWSALNASMEQMHRAMASVEASGNSDVDFVRLMLPHHQGALDMAKTQLMYGTDPQMRRLAQEIITDQQSEIALMHLWLQQRAAPAAHPGPASDTRE